VSVLLFRAADIGGGYRAGSPWGLLLRAPTDPDVRVEDASGSSRCGFAVPHTIPSLCGDTLGGSMSSAWFRRLVHNAAPPSLHGVREGPFPRFHTTMGRCDSLPSFSPRFVSFAGRYHRSVPCSSPAAQDKAADQPGVGKPDLPPAMTMETTRSPKFPGNPDDHSPCSSDPGVTRQTLWVQV
jgi:hypothetical protein